MKTLAAVVVPLLLLTLGAHAQETRVHTTQGWVQGERSGDTVRHLGIPYAAPPVGVRRWQPPHPAPSWTGTRDATEFGAMCPQRDIPTGNTKGDEDCLFLNVWRPKPLPQEGTKPLPVVFFIHGGGFVLGASQEGEVLGGFYNGAPMAVDGRVVVVTINYRLGVLGFLAHPSLARDSGVDRSGNYGLLDALQALQWVHENIAAFGGDPNRVMVFGESAGAYLTCAVVASPLAKGLVSSAVMESGSCSASTRERREEQGVEFATRMGCPPGANTRACLRMRSTEELVENQANFSLAPAAMDLGAPSFIPFAGLHVDGHAVPDSPIQMIRQGRHNHVPMIIGTNENEFDLFIGPKGPWTCGAYQENATTIFGVSAGLVMERYPCKGLPRFAASDALSDMMFTCGARRILRALSANQQEPVYRYVFTHTSYGPLAPLRAAHFLELPYVFGTLSAFGTVGTPGERRLSAAMLHAWTNLAASGNPNGPGVPTWEPYRPLEDNVLVLDTTISQTSGLHAANCDFWDSLSKE